jgi:hypothetical protein
MGEAAALFWAAHCRCPTFWRETRAAEMSSVRERVPVRELRDVGRRIGGRLMGIIGLLVVIVLVLLILRLL